MPEGIRWVFVLMGVGISASTCRAHFNMLFPQAAFVEKGQEVVVRYQWGHPFEHQLFNAPDPQRLMVLGPDGQKTDLTAKLEKIVQPSGAQEKIMTFQLRYRPDQRGDYLFVLTTPPIWMEEEQEFFKDVVKVVLHVQAQKGWDASAGEVLEWLPLTRPYGLQPGMVMQAQFLAEQKPLGGTLVEIEKYNAVPPKKLPPDEHITRTSKTDLNGIVTTTLPEAGWWGLTAGRENGKREHQGKMYPLRQRSTFWLHVDGPIRFTEEKKDDSP